MLTREVILDMGWIVVLILVLPVAIAGTAIACGFLLAHRGYIWTRTRLATWS